MALIEYDVYKQKLRDLEPELTKLSAALDIDAARQEAERLESETAMDGFWNDLARSQKVQMRLKQLQNKVAKQEKLISAWEDLVTLCEMGQEEDDADILEELKSEYAGLVERVEETRMTTLLSGEYDNSNVILQFHAGAGQIRRGREYITKFCGDDCILGGGLIYDHVVDGMFQFAFFQTQAGCCVGLGIKIAQQDFQPQIVKTGGQVYRCGGFSNAALLVDDGNDFAHGAPPYCFT